MENAYLIPNENDEDSVILVYRIKDEVHLHVVDHGITRFKTQRLEEVIDALKAVYEDVMQGLIDET